jgi:hypothetical protein
MLRRINQDVQKNATQGIWVDLQPFLLKRGYTVYHWTRDGKHRFKWRNRCAIRYFYIDFGEAEIYTDQHTATTFGRRGQVKDIPEY